MCFHVKVIQLFYVWMKKIHILLRISILHPKILLLLSTSSCLDPIALMMPPVMALWEKLLLILWIKAWMGKEMEKKRRNEVIMKMEEGTPASHQKEILLSEVQNVTLWMMLGCSLQVGVWWLVTQGRKFLIISLVRIILEWIFYIAQIMF